jgi:hypothetical protein
MRLSPVEIAVLVGAVGSVVAIAVPAFFKNLSASKLSEPIDGLDRMVRSAVAYSEAHPQEISFPPSAPQTPAQVPRGVRALDPPEAWEHLTWRALDFRFDEPHAFAFKFESQLDPATSSMRFIASAHGDLDGDGVVSTFEVQGLHLAGEHARILPGMFIDREVE